jgi:protoporphyrinogen oxidase
MERRKFLKISSLATLPLILKSCDWGEIDGQFLITVYTDIHTGHLIFKSSTFPKTELLTTNTLVVGGGVSGLSAANQLGNKDFLLCELSDDLGGTSSSITNGGVTFAQGAHYDLAYPSNYGQEGLELLKSLDIVEYQSWKDTWSFKDKQFIVPNPRKNQCFEDGKMRSDVLPEGELKEKFQDLLRPYYGRMPMPTTLVDEELRELNELSFYDFLQNNLALTPAFKRSLDYHMLDDWGGNTNQVSALAGIHYFTCRPYETQVVDLFSPPDGNGYFIKKLANNLPTERLLTSHLVKSIRAEEDGFVTEVVDIKSKSVKTIKSSKVIYAGQKHALKYIMPEQYRYFEENVYAPWLVLNFVLKNELKIKGFWQNEMLMEDETFMGFVDSDMQETGNKSHRILTAYYCLPPESRNDLKNVETNKEVIVEKTIGYLNQYFGQDISSLIQEAHIKVMGHAMPVPKPGYLFDDKNINRLHKNMTFAGVDNARLPLFFEAMDAGIQAAKLLED